MKPLIESIKLREAGQYIFVYSKMSKEKTQLESIKEEPHTDGHSLIHIADKDLQVAGDDSSTKIMQEKPEAAGDFQTENDKMPLSRSCWSCGKITDHGFFDCPKRETVRKLLAYCKVCNKAGHDFTNCAKATEDVLKKLAYCTICRKNTDHKSFDCPKENGWVMYDGVRLPNVCDLCNKFGHVGEECPLDSDHTLEFDPMTEDDW